MATDKDLKDFNPKFPPVNQDYNPERDIAPVDQVGFIDLHDAFVNGSIPGDLGVDEAAFNGVDDPASLIDRPSDKFDAYRKADYVHKGMSAATAAAPAEAGAATDGNAE